MYAVYCVQKNVPKKTLYGIVVITSRKEINKRRGSPRKFSCFGIICQFSITVLDTSVLPLARLLARATAVHSIRCCVSCSCPKKQRKSFCCYVPPGGKCADHRCTVHSDQVLHIFLSCSFLLPTFIQIGKSHMPPCSLTGLTVPFKKYQGSQFVSAHIK